jgi:hypothetical protein
MRRLQFRGILGALAILGCVAPTASAQTGFEKVRIKTVDGAELSGRFYAGKGETPAVAMLLHGFKENSNSKEWTNLAKALQKKGFAVLSFDFRGFGSGTTEVDPAIFWAQPFNAQSFLRQKEQISSKEFKPGYYPALVNDIAAAKAFLDRRNDGNAGGPRCNSSNLVLIGSREGATLGAIWLNSEWHRYKVKYGPTGQPLISGFGGVVRGVADTQQPAAGNGVVGAIWMGISPRLGPPPAPILSLESILITAAKKQYVPMAFMYGEKDASAKKIATNLERKLVVYKKLKNAKGELQREEKYRYTGKWLVKDTKLEGAGLLEQGDTVDQVIEWVDAVVQAKNNEWVEQDFRKSSYVWVMEGLVIAPQIQVTGELIKNPTELNLRFSTYSKFMGR